MVIKAGITAEGFRTAVRDYTEVIVVEELAANSYDADATTFVALLDADGGYLHLIDDGIGFDEEGVVGVATLGAGDKREIPISKGKRHYLGSYGYGLKSTLNICTKLEIESYKAREKYEVSIDWNKLDDSLKLGFEGFPFEKMKHRSNARGTWITLHLKNPTTKAHLDQFGEVLSNIPTDNGKFRCFFGMYNDVAERFANRTKSITSLKTIVRAQAKKGLLQEAGSSLMTDLTGCVIREISDRVDKNVKAKIYFAGVYKDQVQHLKRGLRGIYVRIHGRLLKQSFTDSKYTYNISKWKKFESGMRVEINVDWLRDQISLSRAGVRFSNEKLEKDFIGVVSRCISAFIQPELKKLDKKKQKIATKKALQRIELGKRRVSKQKDIVIPGLSNGFIYRPETDAELAVVLSQPIVMKKVLPNHFIVDYNDQAPFDCLVYSEERREFINVELEPKLTSFLEHKQTHDIDYIIVWTKTGWRIGAGKKGRNGFLKLIADDQKRTGWYKLLEFVSDKSAKPRKDYPVIVIEEILIKK